MAATIYLRDGGHLVILETHTVTSELVISDSGYRHALICRDRRGQIVARFDRDSVLAYRRKHHANRQTCNDSVSQPDSSRQRVVVGAG